MSNVEKNISLFTNLNILKLLLHDNNGDPDINCKSTTAKNLIPYFVLS